MNPEDLWKNFSNSVSLVKGRTIVVGSYNELVQQFTAYPYCYVGVTAFINYRRLDALFDEQSKAFKKVLPLLFLHLDKYDAIVQFGHVYLDMRRLAKWYVEEYSEPKQQQDAISEMCYFLNDFIRITVTAVGKDSTPEQIEESLTTFPLGKLKSSQPYGINNPNKRIFFNYLEP